MWNSINYGNAILSGAHCSFESISHHAMYMCRIEVAWQKMHVLFIIFFRMGESNWYCFSSKFIKGSTGNCTIWQLSILTQRTRKHWWRVELPEVICKINLVTEKESLTVRFLSTPVLVSISYKLLRRPSSISLHRIDTDFDYKGEIPGKPWICKLTRCISSSETLTRS